MIIKSVEIKSIVDFLGENLLRVAGPVDGVSIDNIPDASHVVESSLDWVNSSRDNKQEIAENSLAKVLVVGEAIEYSTLMAEKKKTLLVVKNPRRTMAMIAGHFFLEKKKAGIHPSAVIDEQAEVNPTACISAGCVLGRCKIGKNTVLMPNVVVYDDVEIGDNCLIQAGVVIGTDGLGCTRDKEGRLTKFPHLGGVIIGDDVEIGANSQVAKGVFSDTLIENGCKINGLCFIAHNSHLEENVWITGDTMLCGSVHVRKNTTIFSNVIVREQRLIGEGVTVGMGSVVTKNIPDGETWLGAPAHKLEKK
ncbi:MAG: hypothetical protein IKH88_09140 [Prevotella sp.]|nr:hypothetical protein [Prevotella sp.]